MTVFNGRIDRRVEEEFERFVSRLTDRDGRNVRSHVEFCEREEAADHAVLWKRLACLLANLAPASVKTTGQRALQFFVADGEFRKQVFALEDTRDGKLLVYSVDALDAATAGGVVRGPIRPQGQGQLFEVGDAPGTCIEIEVLSAKGTSEAPDYYKHLLGWNRKALKITLRTNAGPAQIDACENLCRLAVRGAVSAAPVVIPPGDVRADSVGA